MTNLLLVSLLAANIFMPCAERLGSPARPHRGAIRSAAHATKYVGQYFWIDRAAVNAAKGTTKVAKLGGRGVAGAARASGRGIKAAPSVAKRGAKALGRAAY